MKQPVFILLLLMPVFTMLAPALPLGVDDPAMSARPARSLGSYLVAQYKMNDNAPTSTVVDSKGYSDGTLYSYDSDLEESTEMDTSVLHTPDGKFGGALNFYGTNYVNTWSKFNTVFDGDFTIALWVKPTDGQPSERQDFLGLFNDEAEHRPQMQVHILSSSGGYSAGQLYFEGRANNDSGSAVGGFDVYTDNAVFTDGQQDWHFIVCTGKQIDPTNCAFNIYFDGNLAGTQIKEQKLNEFYNASLNLYLGASNVNSDGMGPRQFFTGALDNFMFFNKALSTNEIATLYNGGSGTENVP